MQIENIAFCSAFDWHLSLSIISLEKHLWASFWVAAETGFTENNRLRLYHWVKSYFLRHLRGGVRSTITGESTQVSEQQQKGLITVN